MAIRQEVETAVQAVTVYTSQSQVTRRGTVELVGDERELVVTGLPSTILTESVRASGVGNVGVRLLDVRTERVYTTEPVAERVNALQSQIWQLGRELDNVKNQQASLGLQMDFVRGLSEKSVDRFSQGLARQQIGLGDATNLLNFVREQSDSIRTALAELNQTRTELEQQIGALQLQHNQIVNPHPQVSYTLIVGVEVAGPGRFQLEATYTEHTGNWRPLYDVRLDVAAQKVNLTYLAEVTQNSGEDWSGVKLTLSTAKPGLGTLPPKLDPWYIDAYAPPVRMAMARAGGGPAFSQAVPMPASVAAAPKMEEPASMSTMDFMGYEASNLNAEVTSSESGVVTFEVSRNTDIPSDNAPHKITIFAEDYPGRFEYIAYPRNVTFAYLQATVTNTGVTLLPGSANIFRDNSFVGTTNLENTQPGQEFKVNLGIDESLKIERDLVEREVDKKFIGGQRRTTYAYRLKITNLADRPATLILTEQLPVSRNEQIKVRPLRIVPNVTPTDLGLLEWRLPLAPKAKTELYYQFTVEHPTDLKIQGLTI